MKRRHGQPPSAASAGARPSSAALAWPLLLSMALGCAAPALQAGELVPDPDHFMGGEPVEPAPPVPRPAPADRAESLAALLQRVLVADPQVRVALAQWQAAEQRRLQLRSRLGPTVSVTGTRGNGLEREFGVLLERHTDRAEAGLRWNLYNGGNDLAELRAGTRELAAAAQDLRRAREDTSERLAETYVDVLRLQTLLPFAQTRLKTVGQLVDQVKRQNAAGKASDADATQAEASLLDAQMQHDLLVSDLDSARAKLAAEVGTEVREALPVVLQPAPAGAAVYGAPGLVDSARMKAEAARERVRPRLSLLAPRIDLEFRRQLGDQTRPAPTTEQQRTWLLTARWDFPVMGETLARRTETQRRAEAAEADADRVARSVQADLKALDARIANAQRTLTLLDQQLLQYDQLLRAGELQFEAGRRTLAQLIQLRESRYNIEQRRVEQAHKLLAARMRQLALVGQLLPALGLPSLPSEVSDPS